MTEKISEAATANNEPRMDGDEVIEKEWSALVYLGGDNNLFDEMVFAVKEMKQSVAVPPKTPGPPPGQTLPRPEFNFHALVQFAAEQPSHPTSAFPLPRRFILKPGDDGLGKDYYKTPAPTNQAQGQAQKPPSPLEKYKKELIEFLVWGICHGRARHYMVIFSGHGLGIESDFLTEDSIPPQSLTVKDLRDVLKDSRVRRALGTSRMEILGLDSCLMAMAEVGYELREEAPLMIASQGSESNLGWPYKSIFASLHSGLQDGRSLRPEQIAAIVTDAFVDYYDDFACAADSSADISACRLRYHEFDYMAELKDAVDSLAKACSGIINATGYKPNMWDPAGNEFAKSLIFAHWYAQTYHSDQYVDLYDLCDILGDNLPQCQRHVSDEHDCEKHGCEKYETVKRRCKRVKEVVDACVVRGTKPRMFSGPLYQYSHGISIYFPWSDIYPLYGADNLDFLKDGEWYEFIGAYTEFTRRPPRDYQHGDARIQGYGTKDSPPHDKGEDAPSVRAKNPPSVWRVGTSYQCPLKELTNLE